jgi:hypothetical protein
MFQFRTFIEDCNVAAGLVSRLEEDELAHHCQDLPHGSKGVQLYDTGGESLLPITKPKANKSPRSEANLDTIVAHVTAVRGGFGVAKKRLAYWRKFLESGTLILNNGDTGNLGFRLYLDVTKNAKSIEDACRVLALCERFKNTPYHTLASRVVGTVRNHPLFRYSHHAGKGNFGVGFGIDCAPDEDLSEDFIEIGQNALLNTILSIQEHSVMPRIRILPHRAFSANRTGDPGARIWQRVICPVVEATEGVYIDYEAKYGSGLPVPTTWDKSALYDRRGYKSYT